MISSSHQNREDAQRHVGAGLIADLKELATGWDESANELRHILKKYGYE